LGKITGVDAVVTGTIQDLIDRVAVNCRLIETETGNIFAAASEKITKDESISKLLSEEIVESKVDEKAEKMSIQNSREKVLTFDKKVRIGGRFGGYCEVKLDSIKILENQEIECTLLYRNIYENEIIVYVYIQRGPHLTKDRTYLIDNYGNKTLCLSASGFTYSNGIASARIPPGITAKLQLLFPEEIIDNENVNLVSYHNVSLPFNSGGFVRAVGSKDEVGLDVVFKEIKLK
jgi:hypothetical protein